MMFQHSSFCGISSSQIPFVFSQPLKQRNPLLHQRQFPLHCPTKTKAFSFKISALGADFSDGFAQIAQNKVLIAAGASAAIGQLFKPFASVILYGKEFDAKEFVQAGGFPSSHSSATVACATFLGLERGFSDPIFGLTVVYASLIMYDAQAVRREVGIHARTLNKLLVQKRVNTLHSKDRESLINSQQRGLSTTPLNVECLEKSLLSQEATSLEPQQENARLVVKPGSNTRQSDRELPSSGFSADSDELSKLAVDSFLPLKESIGHTEVEVLAGAFLGILVGLVVHNFT